MAISEPKRLKEIARQEKRQTKRLRKEMRRKNKLAAINQEQKGSEGNV